jgi:protein-S-isoprenylcysteine O-methyltransferase Ste14
MTIYLAAIGVIWLIFSLVWLVGALTAKRTMRRSWFGDIWWRVGIIGSVIVLFNLLQGSRYLTGALPIPALNVLGVVCTAAGVALAVWARVYLGRDWGMPLTVKENPELMTSGPYATIRNPIYTGVSLALLGSALVDWWWAVVLVWSAAYFMYASRREEQLMLKEFPDTYSPYKARTWRFIPFIC